MNKPIVYDYHNKEIFEGDTVTLVIPSSPYTVIGDGWVDVDQTERIEFTGVVCWFEKEWFIFESEESGIPLDFEYGQILYKKEE